VTVRVVVVDDHPLIRQGVRALLSSIADMEVVGEAGDGDEALVVTREAKPDVVMMDLHMSGSDGLTATRRITAEFPGIGVLVVTMLDDDASVFAALKAGARGYVVKGADQDQIHRAISAVARGEALLGPTIAGRVLQTLTTSSGSQAEPFPQLTSREREILDAVAAGKNNSTIARSLFLSPHTVANHVSNILLKLQAADRAAAIIQARDAGLGGKIQPVE
jgi:DNA-binding NarL/FixJ family response regulator